MIQELEFIPNQIDNLLIKLALEEDLGQLGIDVTSTTLFSEDSGLQQANIISKHHEAMTICGIEIIPHILKLIDTQFEIETKFQDGDCINPGEPVLTLYANAKSLLMAERTVLNFMRHLSAVATLTEKFVSQTKGTNTKILDTRKTTPGMRHMEKYAVQCGGGVNHRMGLYDAFMVKDTHVDLLGGIDTVLEKLPDKTNNVMPVIFEIRNPNELHQVLDMGVNKITRVLLDNMSPNEIKSCVELVAGKVETEASGNINLETIKAIAASGVDYASVGMLTHSCGQIDLSMQIF